LCHEQCCASYSGNVIKLLITPFKSNQVTVLITLFQVVTLLVTLGYWAGIKKAISLFTI